MPKSKRAKVFHLTQVKKKTREHKDALFDNIRESVPRYQHCFVFGVDNMRNNYLKDIRHALGSDCRFFFGKTKLTARALGTTPEDAQADGIDGLAPLLHGNVGLIFTNRDPAALQAWFAARAPAVDFARAGAVAPRTVRIAPGPLRTMTVAGGADEDEGVPLAPALEPELRQLGLPVRLKGGRIVLEAGPAGADGEGESESGGYTICREGQVLEARQTRLLKLFGVYLSEFQVKLLAYWSAATGEVTRLQGEAMDVEEADGADDDE